MQPPSSSALVRIINLAKNYGPIAAVQDVSFELAHGEIFGLLGQNGAGKTTTIECLLGLRRPDAGTITMNGIDVLTNPTRARQHVGAQLQSAALQDKITPQEALQLFASFYAQPANPDSLLAQFDLTAKARAPFASLSGGQKQRLFLALALVSDPKILILDEPTAGLDPQARRELHQIITGLKTAGRTVLLCTHDLEEADTLCDRIGILHRGRLIANATPTELISRASARSRVRFRTKRLLEAPTVTALPGVESHRPSANGWLVETTDVNLTINGLTRTLVADNNEMLDLQIIQPTLEDAFIELTGQVWSAPPAEDTA